MPTKSLRLALHRICAMLVLVAITIPALASRPPSPLNQTDWKQWTAKDVHEVLYKSPWVSSCCREWDTLPPESGPSIDAGYIASIVSSLAVRQALARRTELDKHYDQLGPAARTEVDQRIANCLKQKFDNFIVVSFSFGFSNPPAEFGRSATPDHIHLLTSDGRKIAGQLVSDSIATECGTFPKDLSRTSVGEPDRRSGLYGPGHEMAFPRYVDGKPTIGPDDKRIRIEIIDFAAQVASYRVRHELDFDVDKLTYEGKPDY
jgi:hypothetical protein